MSHEEKIALISRKDLTLNGNPAIVMGASQPFATVFDTVTLASFKWAWGTVARIASQGGMFRA